jgi:small subunit ribosomal protein S27e
MSRFLRVQCDCGQDAVVFGDSKTVVKCQKCGKTIVEPMGGRARINCRIVEVLP